MLWLIAMPLRFRVCESWITWGLSTPHTNENRPFYTTDVLSVWQREKGNVHASFPIMQWVRVKVRLGFSPCPQSPLSVSFSFLYVVCVCVCVRWDVDSLALIIEYTCLQSAHRSSSSAHRPLISSSFYGNILSSCYLIKAKSLSELEFISFCLTPVSLCCKD